MDYSLPGSSLHGILQARIREWVTISFSRGSSWPRDRTWVSHIAGRHFNLWATREALVNYILKKEGIFELNDRHCLCQYLLVLNLFVHCMTLFPSHNLQMAWNSPAGISKHFTHHSFSISQELVHLKFCLDFHSPNLLISLSPWCLNLPSVQIEMGPLNSVQF